MKFALLKWKEDQRVITNSEQQIHFVSIFINDNEKRHSLIESVVLAISDEENSLFLISAFKEEFSISQDIFWMIERLQSYSCTKVQKIWCQLIEQNFNRQDAKQIDAIIVATQTNNILQEVFTSYFIPIDLNSIQADQLRADCLRMQKMQQHRQNSPLLDPPPRERVLQLLEKLESGDLSAWWQLNMEMTLKPDSTHCNYNNEFEWDLTKLPGWQEANKIIRNRIIEGANKYIQNQNSVDYEWIGTNGFDRPALAGCRALQLLLRESPDFFNNLSPEIWQKWAPVIIAAPNSNQNEDQFLEIVKHAYQNAPEEIKNTLVLIIDKKGQESVYPHILSHLDKFWDERLKLVILEKAKDPLLSPNCVEKLLEELLKGRVSEAIDFAKSLISFPLSLVENERNKALIASRVLVKNSDSSSWLFIWSLVQQNSSFGREVFELFHHREEYKFLQNLTERQLADLYIWLVHQYPYEEDPDYSNDIMWHGVTARDCIVNMKRYVLSHIKERSTHNACTEIQRIIQDFPYIPWLREILIEAQINMRRKTWQPLTSEEFFLFVINQEPSNLDLSNQIDAIDQRTKKMEDEPKTINISDSSINAPVGTSGVTNSNVTIASSNAKKGVNWGNWLAIAVAIVAIPLSMSVSGAFNEEFKEWFKHVFPSKI
jgi:hypothetical protein